MRKTVIRISLLLIVASLLGLAVLRLGSHRSSHSISASPRPSTNTNVPDVLGMPEVPVDAIPTSDDLLWRFSSRSNAKLAQCFKQERIGLLGLHTLTYTNDIPGAQASVSWVTGVVDTPDYFTSAIQHCVTGVDHPSDLTELTPGDSVTSRTSETMAAKESLRSYATATSVNRTMLLTFWTQPGSPVITPSPANAIAFRAVALYKLAALGVTDPEVVPCQMVAERPITKVPTEVETLIKTRYAKLAPVRIYYQYAQVVDVRAESITPHICVYSDGRQVAYAGKVPTSATEAIQVDVKHAPSPPTESVETFVTVVKIPTQGWIVVDEWG